VEHGATLVKGWDVDQALPITESSNAAEVGRTRWTARVDGKTMKW